MNKKTTNLCYTVWNFTSYVLCIAFNLCNCMFETKTVVSYTCIRESVHYMK